MQYEISLNIQTEYSKLNSVIVHRPGAEIDRLTPENKFELLFEDIPFLSKMQDEHDNFVACLKNNEINVLYFNELLTQILEIPNVRKSIIAKVCSLEQVNSLSEILLSSFTISELSEILITGVSTYELYEKTGILFNNEELSNDFLLLNPCPNTYFTRDPAAIVGNQIVSTKMHFQARIRETILFLEIFKNHPIFKNPKFVFGDSLLEDRPYCIEGGDIIILNSEAIAVGCSQRTRSHAISKLAKNLFASGIVQRVYEIFIPSERAYMHLDTVFTVINEGIVMAYPNVMEEIKEIKKYIPQYYENEIYAISSREKRSFNQILTEEFGSLKVIKTGDNNPRFASREQLADGTNVFAIAPSMVITYDRNIHSNKALEKNGINVIKIEGSELVRGLGGPRCMTMPLNRINL